MYFYVRSLCFVEVFFWVICVVVLGMVVCTVGRCRLSVLALWWCVVGIVGVFMLLVCLGAKSFLGCIEWLFYVVVLLW